MSSCQREHPQIGKDRFSLKGPQHRPHNKESIQEREKQKFASGATNTVLQKESTHRKGRTSTASRSSPPTHSRESTHSKGKENPVSRSSRTSTSQQENTASKQACLSGPQNRLHTYECTHSQGQQNKIISTRASGPRRPTSQAKSTCPSQCKPRSRRTQAKILQHAHKPKKNNKIYKKSSGRKTSKIKKKY